MAGIVNYRNLVLARRQRDLTVETDQREGDGKFLCYVLVGGQPAGACRRCQVFNRY
jgi:hypothetical protein